MLALKVFMYFAVGGFALVGATTIGVLVWAYFRDRKLDLDLLKAIEDDKYFQEVKAEAEQLKNSVKQAVTVKKSPPQAKSRARAKKK